MAASPGGVCGAEYSTDAAQGTGARAVPPNLRLGRETGQRLPRAPSLSVEASAPVEARSGTPTPPPAEPSTCPGRELPARSPTRKMPAGVISLVIDIEPQRQAAGVEHLGLLLERVVAGALDVAKGALEPGAAVESGAAGHLHRPLDRRDRAAPGQRPSGHRAARGLRSRLRGLGGLDHPLERHLGGGERVLHLADQIRQVRILRPLARQLERPGARRFGYSDIGRI